MKITIPLILGLITGFVVAIWFGPQHNWRSITIHTDGTWSYKASLDKIQQTTHGRFVLQDARAYLLNQGRIYPRSDQKRVEITLDVPQNAPELLASMKTQANLIYGDKTIRCSDFGSDCPFEGYLIIPPKKTGLVRFTFIFDVEDIPNQAKREIINGKSTLAVFNNIKIEREDLTNH